MLQQRYVPVDLLVTIAASVARCLNYFSANDLLGTDPVYEDNLALATDPQQYVENIHFPAQDRVSHMAISRIGPSGEG
ncbi:hypothetical protein [Acinetobacter sp. WZC-1]|uniref:hypothetical protein n=1 Tax=Acinetobacter sp. WZC-1 TaxID=3459034 RepID=UPI00403DDC5A